MAVAQVVVDQLLAWGVEHVVLAPGSRSAPLAYALADAAGLTLHVRVDERTAGFLALGLARSSLLQSGAGTIKPVVVVTTSGTAVANLHPAVLEAHHSQIPLLVISADRPHEMRGVGASQTTHQVGIFGQAVRYQVDVPAPAGHDTSHLERECRDVASVLTRGLAAAVGARSAYPGPVHINLAFREPLHPQVDTSPQQSDGASQPVQPSQPDQAHESTALSQPGSFVVCPAPTTRLPATTVPAEVSMPAQEPMSVGAQVSGAAHLSPLSAPWTLSPATVVIAGDGADALVQEASARGDLPALHQAAQLAQAQGWPLMAEPTAASASSHSICGYQTLLAVNKLAADIEQAVVFGRPTLSRSVARLLARRDVEVTVIAPGSGPWPDASRNARRVLDQIPADLLAPLVPAGQAQRPDTDFMARWRRASDMMRDILDGMTGPGAASATGLIADRALMMDRTVASDRDGHQGGLTGPAVARQVLAAAARDAAGLVLGASNPIRDVDLVLGLDQGLPHFVASNRGLAGIDGTIATAMGMALGQHRPVYALMGDLTFFHDAGSLMIPAAETSPQLRIVVVNDNGGSIFELLEHGALSATSPRRRAIFERVFATPQQASIAHLCAAYGHTYRLARSHQDLVQALAGGHPGSKDRQDQGREVGLGQGSECGQGRAGGIDVIEVQIQRTDRAAQAQSLMAQVATEAARRGII